MALKGMAPSSSALRSVSATDVPAGKTYPSGKVGSVPDKSLSGLIDKAIAN